MNKKITRVIVSQENISQNCDFFDWTFKTYVSPTGRQDVQLDLNKEPPKVVQPFKTSVRYLANTKKIDWHEPDAKKLKGVQDIYEIRFKANNRQYRPLGFFGTGPQEFTILIWASKKGSVWSPSEAIKTADNRRKEILAGKATCTPLKIDGEEFPCIEES